MSFQDDEAIQPEWPCCREAKSSGKIGCLGPHVSITAGAPNVTITGALTSDSAITIDDVLAEMRHNQVRRSLDSSPFLAEHGVDSKRMCIPTPPAEPVTKEASSWVFVAVLIGAFVAVVAGLACFVRMAY